MVAATIIQLLVWTPLNCNQPIANDSEIFQPFLLKFSENLADNVPQVGKETANKYFYILSPLGVLTENYRQNGAK